MSNNDENEEIEVMEEVEDAEVLEEEIGTDDILTNEVEAKEVIDELADASDLDKVEEYFRTKGVTRTLRNDLKDLKIQMPEMEELDKLNKRVKELREKVKDNEDIRVLTEKLQTAKERMELLKELIRIELLESAQEEVKRNGRKLKIVNILREMKDEGDKKKKPSKQFFRS